jgi:serine/threonine-protein kinase
MRLAPGETVSPTLRLLRPLSEGGMGSVWVAEHLTLGTEVAVKFVSPEAAAAVGGIERFSREAAAAARMKHPHVVQILDHGKSEQGIPYIAMELLEGESLACRLARGGPLSIADTCTVVAQIAKALTKAHALGLVHRDIKPDNVFLTDLDGDVFVKVLDFGIAKQAVADARALTATGALIGTPRYMSPEQAMSSRDVDARADLWSLAAVAYESLTAVPPFDGETVGAVFVVIHRGDFRPPSDLTAGLPPLFDAWFAKAFAKDIAVRFASARELADGFAACVSGAGLSPQRDGVVARSAPLPAVAPVAASDIEDRTLPMPPKPAGLTPRSSGRQGSARPEATLSPSAFPGARATRRRAIVAAATALGTLAAISASVALVWSPSRGDRVEANAQTWQDAVPATSVPAAAATAPGSASPPAPAPAPSEASAPDRQAAAGSDAGQASGAVGSSTRDAGHAPIPPPRASAPPAQPAKKAPPPPSCTNDKYGVCSPG